MVLMFFMQKVIDDDVDDAEFDFTWLHIEFNGAKKWKLFDIIDTEVI